MAKDEIIEKLKALMERLPISDEPNVAYLLTQVRKVFERDPSARTHSPTLTFYCDWALHTTLDRAAARTYLNAVLPIFTVNGVHDAQAQAALDSLLSLRTFRDELAAFFVNNGIDDGLCSTPQHWSAFLNAYSHVVQGSELILTGAGSATPVGPLNLAVKSVTVRALAGVTATNDLTFPMVWLIRYTNGQEGELTLSNEGLLGAVLDLR